LFRNSSFITPTASPALTVGSFTLSTVQVSLPLTIATVSIAISTSVPQVSFIPSSSALIVPGSSALIVPSSSRVSSSSNMTRQGGRFTFNAYAPLEFSAIQGQPHAFPTTNYVKNLPKFQGNDVINV
jgi:hypothetical protein